MVELGYVAWSEQRAIEGRTVTTVARWAVSPTSGWEELRRQAFKHVAGIDPTDEQLATMRGIRDGRLPGFQSVSPDLPLSYRYQKPAGRHKSSWEFFKLKDSETANEAELYFQIDRSCKATLTLKG